MEVEKEEVVEEEEVVGEEAVVQVSTSLMKMPSLHCKTFDPILCNGSVLSI